MSDSFVDTCTEFFVVFNSYLEQLFLLPPRKLV